MKLGNISAKFKPGNGGVTDRVMASAKDVGDRVIDIAVENMAKTMSTVAIKDKEHKMPCSTRVQISSTIIPEVTISLDAEIGELNAKMDVSASRKVEM